MFRSEKIFQQDDNLYIDISIFFKSFFIFLSIYIFSILEFYSIFDLLDYNIYLTSKYFHISIFFSISYLIFSFIFRLTKKRYVIHYLSFLLNDIVPLLVTVPFTLYLLFLLKIDFNIDTNNSYLLILIIVNLFIARKILNSFYKHIMNNNNIQRNIMLVGSINSIAKILEEKKDKINIYKCCFIKDDYDHPVEEARSILKIPVFTNESEIRIILEYHELGQIWILDNEDKSLVNYFLDTVIKFSVDIIIVSLKDKGEKNIKLLSDNLINNKYSYSNYQTSRFYGLNLLYKLIFDKILGILFLLLASPLLVLAMIFIYIEDGFPIFFVEESAGWDGRRFNVHKLRIHRKDSLNKKILANENNKKLLRIGKIINKLRVDEIPQLYNILKGDMSIVGPRPHILKDDLNYAKVFKQFLKRNKASPGLTGWAQVNGFRGKNPRSTNMKKRMEHDLWYMDNWSIWLDVYIILKTFYIIFTKPIK
ncbi:sugar transferase [Pelagibacteraceae bacterium]|nr:sugar transferase [Pelagibacteraceae bacterium]